MWVVLDFSILHVVVLEELWTFVLGTKQLVRVTSGFSIHIVHFNVCRKPGLAEPELRLNWADRNEPSLSLYVGLEDVWIYNWM